MSIEKKRNALNDDNLNEVSGGYVKEINKDTLGVFDDHSRQLIGQFESSYTGKNKKKHNQAMAEAWQKANELDNAHHRNNATF